jgi:hypothetical protein
VLRGCKKNLLSPIRLNQYVRRDGRTDGLTNRPTDWPQVGPRHLALSRDRRVVGASLTKESDVVLAGYVKNSCCHSSTSNSIEPTFTKHAVRTPLQTLESVRLRHGQLDEAHATPKFSEREIR